MSGFIALHREAFSHPLLKDPERFRAWFWLVAEAAWKPTRVRIKGDVVTLERGDLSYSVRYLAEAWGWSKSRVDRFLGDLRDEGMIETRSKIGTTAGHKAGQGQSIISICNYEKYQDERERGRDNDEPHCGTTAGQQRDNSGTKKNKGTREQEEPNGSYSPPTPQIDFSPDAAQPAETSRPAAKRKPPAKPPCPCPVGVNPQTWGDFLAMRSRMGAPVSETVVAGFRREADRVGWTLEQAISESVLRGWRGFKADWVKNDDRRNAHQPGPARPARTEGDGFTRALDRLDGSLGAGSDGLFDRPARAAYR